MPVTSNLPQSDVSKVTSRLQAAVTTTAKPGTSHGVIPKKGGLSGGAVAGVAIGGLVAGILIAGVVFFLLLRRQKQKQASIAAYQSHHLSQKGYTKGPAKGPIVATSAVPTNIDDLLPQPVADDTITDEVSKIRDNIKNHVRTYYHSAPVSAAGLNEAGMRDLATTAGVSSSVLLSTLSNPSTRNTALRLVIAWVILSRCTGERNASLLPVELAALAASISGEDGSSITQPILYSKWKAITGTLLQQRFGKHVQDQSFANTIAELDSNLAPFVQGSVDGGQRRKNLDMILTRSSSFAFLLFSQPGSFHFDFSNTHGGLIAFPALVQAIGDQGQVLSPARVLVEKEVAA